MSNDVNLPSWCVRGAEVICVTPDDWAELKALVVDPFGVMRYPEAGERYTIRRVRMEFVPEYMEVIVGLELEEIITPIASGGSGKGGEIAWDVRAFQPVKRAKARARRRASVPA